MSFVKNLFLLVIVSFSLLANIECKNEAKHHNIIPGYVVGIADGDSFTLLTKEKKQVRIRLYGIDCPEQKQDFGQVAKQKLSMLIFNSNVLVEKKGIDRYGRTVAIVYDDQKRCINEAMLSSGLAWHYIKYDTNPTWDQLQKEARANKIGLWAQPNPIAPWEWRIKQHSSTN